MADEMMTLKKFYDVRDGMWRCRLCEFTSPHDTKARRHALGKHGVEIPVVVIVRPHYEVPTEMNVPILEMAEEETSEEIPGGMNG